MDKWILSKLNTLIKRVDDDLWNYRVTEPALAIQDFVDELSTGTSAAAANASGARAM